MPLNIDIQQILLHLLNFVILIAILYFLLYKPVAKFMKKREDYYRAFDEKTKKDLAEAEQKRAEYEKRLKSARGEIDQMKEASRLEAAENGRRVTEQARREADAILAEARAQAQAEHDQLIRSAKREITEIVADAVEKVAAGGSVSDSYDGFLNTVESEAGDEK